MVKTYSRMLALVLAAAVAAFSVQRVALAAAQTPEEIVQATTDQMGVAYAAFSDRVDVLVDEAVSELSGKGAGDLTLTKRLKGLAGFMAVLDKECDKSVKQIRKIEARGASQLERLGADAEFGDQVSGIANIGASSVNIRRYSASDEVYSAVGEYTGFLH